MTTLQIQRYLADKATQDVELKMPLNPGSPVPLYRQLAERLSDDIAAGRYAVDERIPSEPVLAEQYGIGRPTVRQATDQLVRRGMLERRRGSGTYVRENRKPIDLFSLAGTSAALRDSQYEAQLEVLSGPRLETDNEQPVLSSRRWIRIDRRALAQQKPILYEVLRFDADVFAGLERRYQPGQSLSTLVREAYYREPTEAEQTFTVVTADRDVAEKLAVPAGEPLLRVARSLHFGDDRDAIQAEIICRTDQFAFSQVLHPEALQSHGGSSVNSSSQQANQK